MLRLISSIGLVLSLLILAIISWWAVEGVFHFQTRSLAGEAIEKWRNTGPPGLFWAVIGFVLALAVAGLSFSLIGLAKKRDGGN
jgi:hypothetical protein